MNATLEKALVALIGVGALTVWLTVMFRRRKTVFLVLQLIGAACLVIVVLTHVCEALHLFPRMRRGEDDSAGHYLDVSSAVAGIALLCTGYLLDQWRRWSAASRGSDG